MARDLIPGDVTIRSIKPGDPRKRLGDGGGLYLLLFVKGGAHGWRLDYTFEGTRKTLSLGTYPDTGLGLARRKADEARRLLSEGVDPSTARKEAKAEKAAEREADKRVTAGLPPLGSFEAVAREWLERVHVNKVTAGHAERTLIRLEQNVFPWIGRLPIASITAPQVLECLRRVEERGAVETAHRIKQNCGQVFRYGIAIGQCERDPSADLRDALRPVLVKHYPTVLAIDRVGELLRAVHGYEGQATTRAALRLAPLLFQRPGELRCAEWDEFDLDAATWLIPSHRMKRKLQGKLTGNDHLVPLSRQAVEILRDLHALTGRGALLFPGLRTNDRPISNVTMNAALRRMGFNGDEMTTHGWRAMARTLIVERLNIPERVVEAQLAHSVPDALGRAYNRTEFVEQRRQMMQAWADYLDHVREGAKVIPLRTA